MARKKKAMDFSSLDLNLDALGDWGGDEEKAEKEFIRAAKLNLSPVTWDNAEAPSLNGMPGGGGAGDKVGLAATDITDEQRRLQQMETDLCLLRIEATRRAYCITASKSSKKQADCLCLYYVKNKKQREVCEELGLSEENQVSIYIKWGSIYLAEIWDSFGNVAQTAQNPP